MSTRTIKLKLLTQSGLVKIESSARTFSELKQDALIKELEIDWEHTKLIDKASRNVVSELEDSVLPATDCILFVTPNQTKSGADLSYREVKQKIKEYKEKGGEVPFNYTQATTKDMNDFWNKVKNQKPVASKAVKSTPEKKAVTKDSQKVEKVPNNDLTKDETFIEKLAGSIANKLGLSKKNESVETKEEEPIVSSIPLEDIAEVITNQELQDEAELLKKLVNKKK